MRVRKRVAKATTAAIAKKFNGKVPTVSSADLRLPPTKPPLTSFKEELDREKPLKWEPLKRYIPKEENFLAARLRKTDGGFGIADMQALAHDLVAWASQEDSFNFGRWMAVYKFSYNTLDIFEKQSEIFKEAMKIAQSLIGNRREVKMMTGEHTSAANHWLPYWIPPYKSYLEWESGLKKDNSTVGDTIKVVYVPAPNTDVPRVETPRVETPCVESKQDECRDGNSSK